MDRAKRRAAKIEAVFRQLNDRIAETARRFQADEVDFVCECADADCTHRVEATLDEYAEVREHERRFLLVNGHEQPDVESVVARRPRYAIVEKAVTPA